MIVSKLKYTFHNQSDIEWQMHRQKFFQQLRKYLWQPEQGRWTRTYMYTYIIITMNKQHTEEKLRGGS